MKNELMIRMQEVRGELYTLLVENNFDLQKTNVIKCSEKLDILIGLYMNMK